MVELLALAAAVCYALGGVLQQHAASEVPADRLLVRLAARRGWLLGIVANAVGWGLQAAALGTGELIVVQPLLVTSVIFMLPLSAVARKAHAGPREWLGTMAVALGLAGFLLLGKPEPGPGSPSLQDWAYACAGSLLAAGACVLVSRRHTPATWLGVASGILFGLAAALTKAAVLSLRGGVVTALLDWPVWGMLAVTALAFYLMQRAFHAGPLVASFPALIAMDPIASSALGVAVFGERLDASPAALACAALVIVSIAALARSDLLPRQGLTAGQDG